jgi:hypothetical protein
VPGWTGGGSYGSGVGVGVGAGVGWTEGVGDGDALTDAGVATDGDGLERLRLPPTAIGLSSGAAGASPAPSRVTALSPARMTIAAIATAQIK